MHFHKNPHPANFNFSPKALPGLRFRDSHSRGQFTLTVARDREGIVRIEGDGPDWQEQESDAGIRFSPVNGSAPKLVDEDGHFAWVDSYEAPCLQSDPGRFFGICGASWMFEFRIDDGDRFYGQGEKWTGFEHSGKSHMFWNTDVWADFHFESIEKSIPKAPDPVYVSVPYLIVKRGNRFFGLLVDTPQATYMSISAAQSVAGQMAIGDTGKYLRVSGYEGRPVLYLLEGPTLPELTRRLQRLVGTTPLPPAWALGYHQCRWGYQSEKDLLSLDKNFVKHGIPVDGLWLDIDYMDGYRVFTWADKHYKDLFGTLAKLARRGREVVPIIDPGVKHEPGYSVYERGKKAGAYCRNPAGGDYVGLVWPGETVFPDFSVSKARKWWADEVAAFAAPGIHGAWLDMNDPATGSVDNSAMLFQNGKKPHSAYHNQYALGMAKASRDGFLKAHPDRRPFLLSRSGFTGSGRYTALWTGDNVSCYEHLRNAIPTTLNLALSGIPFNGPDIGGFGGDTYPKLICDWHKACFLFPFFRNHSIAGSREQEPWAFDEQTLEILRTFIRLRYRLRHYLVQLFAEHEITGDAILRPLFYDFEGADLDLVDDQFLVGPAILQAPFLVEKQRERDVILPSGCRWYSIFDRAWLEGGQTLAAKAAPKTTPIYVRDGSILPLSTAGETENSYDATKVDFHLFLSGDGSEAETIYRADDGISFGYQSGKRTEWRVHARRDGAKIEVTISEQQNGFGGIDAIFTTEKGTREVTINGRRATKVKAVGVPFGRRPTQSWAA